MYISPTLVSKNLIAYGNMSNVFSNKTYLLSFSEAALYRSYNCLSLFAKVHEKCT
jgi:hypothetical protein